MVNIIFGAMILLVLYLWQEWIVQPLGVMITSKHHFSTIIPDIKNLLGTVAPVLVPGCSGSSSDIIAFCTKGQLLDVFADKAISKVTFGANWDPVNPNVPIDLDLGCMLLDANGESVDHVNYRQLRSVCGSIVHGGDAADDLGGDIDDEEIHVNLATLPPSVTTIAFFLTCFNGRPLVNIDTCAGHLFETESKNDLVLCDCIDDDIKRHRGTLLCVIFRGKDRWLFLNVSICCHGATMLENVPVLKDFIKNSAIIQEYLK